MPQLDDFLRTWEMEFRTTLHLFSAYPANRLQFRPHEIARTAAELMWTIVREEEEFINGSLRGKFAWKEVPAPKTKDALVRELKKRHEAAVKKVKQAGEALFSKQVPFFVAKGKIAPVSVKDLVWGMLHDQIHHRGQLSVYLRIVGGKVPSIYGPSADEPW